MCTAGHESPPYICIYMEDYTTSHANRLKVPLHGTYTTNNRNKKITNKATVFLCLSVFSSHLNHVIEWDIFAAKTVLDPENKWNPIKFNNHTKIGSKL